MNEVTCTLEAGFGDYVSGLYQGLGALTVMVIVLAIVGLYAYHRLK